MEKFFYRVQEGDSVFSVANRFSIPVSLIVSTNNLKKEISEGDILYMEKSCGRTYKVQPFDRLSDISLKFCVPEQEILKNNGVPYVFYGLTITV